MSPQESKSLPKARIETILEKTTVKVSESERGMVREKLTALAELETKATAITPLREQTQAHLDALEFLVGKVEGKSKAKATHEELKKMLQILTDLETELATEIALEKRRFEIEEQLKTDLQALGLPEIPTFIEWLDELKKEVRGEKGEIKNTHAENLTQLLDVITAVLNKVELAKKDRALIQEFESDEWTLPPGYEAIIGIFVGTPGQQGKLDALLSVLEKEPVPSSSPNTPDTGTKNADEYEFAGIKFIKNRLYEIGAEQGTMQVQCVGVTATGRPVFKITVSNVLDRIGKTVVPSEKDLALYTILPVRSEREAEEAEEGDVLEGEFVFAGKNIKTGDEYMLSIQTGSLWNDIAILAKRAEKNRGGWSLIYEKAGTALSKKDASISDREIEMGKAKLRTHEEYDADVLAAAQTASTLEKGPKKVKVFGEERILDASGRVELRDDEKEPKNRRNLTEGLGEFLWDDTRAILRLTDREEISLAIPDVGVPQLKQPRIEVGDKEEPVIFVYDTPGVKKLYRIELRLENDPNAYTGPGTRQTFFDHQTGLVRGNVTGPKGFELPISTAGMKGFGDAIETAVEGIKKHVASLSPETRAAWKEAKKVDVQHKQEERLQDGETLSFAGHSFVGGEIYRLRSQPVLGDFRVLGVEKDINRLRVEGIGKDGKRTKVQWLKENDVQSGPWMPPEQKKRERGPDEIKQEVFSRFGEIFEVLPSKHGLAHEVIIRGGKAGRWRKQDVRQLIEEKFRRDDFVADPRGVSKDMIVELFNEWFDEKAKAIGRKAGEPVGRTVEPAAIEPASREPDKIRRTVDFGERGKVRAFSRFDNVFHVRENGDQTGFEVYVQLERRYSKPLMAEDVARKIEEGKFPSVQRFIEKNAISRETMSGLFREWFQLEVDALASAPVAGEPKPPAPPDAGSAKKTPDVSSKIEKFNDAEKRTAMFAIFEQWPVKPFPAVADGYGVESRFGRLIDIGEISKIIHEVDATAIRKKKETYKSKFVDQEAQKQKMTLKDEFDIDIDFFADRGISPKELADLLWEWWKTEKLPKLPKLASRHQPYEYAGPYRGKQEPGIPGVTFAGLAEAARTAMEIDDAERQAEAQAAESREAAPPNEAPLDLTPASFVDRFRRALEERKKRKKP